MIDAVYPYHLERTTTKGKLSPDQGFTKLLGEGKGHSLYFRHVHLDSQLLSLEFSPDTSNILRIKARGEYGSLAKSRFALPPLKPPIEGLIGLLEVPNTAKLHVPVSIHITIRNRHPTRSANIVVQLEPDAADSFIVAGMRNGRLPILLPGCEGKLTWNLVPVECGFVRIPKLKVLDRRVVIDAQVHSGSAQGFEDDAEPVEVVDIRWDRTLQDVADVAEASGEVMQAAKVQGKADGPRAIADASILVLP